MKHLDAPAGVALGAALLIAVNAIVLGGAWSNRSGDPDATLEVSIL